MKSLNENKIHHIINGSKKSDHKWETLVPDKNWDDIAVIMPYVFTEGEDGKYKGFLKRVHSPDIEDLVHYKPENSG